MIQVSDWRLTSTTIVVISDQYLTTQQIEREVQNAPSICANNGLGSSNVLVLIFMHYKRSPVSAVDLTTNKHLFGC